MPCCNCPFENAHSHIAHINAVNGPVARYTFNVYYVLNDREYMAPYLSHERVRTMLRRAVAGEFTVNDVHLAHVY